MNSIQNHLISVSCKAEGAELTSVYHKEHQLEYLWQAGAEWAKHAPILFPIVGQLKDNTYLYEGVQYEMARHGFARTSVFAVHDQSDEHITYRLVANEQSLKQYPFLFTFDVKYSLQNAVLSIEYIIHNKDKKEMLFSVGAHPAFKIPLRDDEHYTDYYLEFDKAETADRWMIDNGLIKATSTPFFTNTKTVSLQKKLFYEDALVFKNLESRTISIRNKSNDHGLHFMFEGFPYFGIWAAKDADFVCLEPWLGIADSVNTDQHLENKEGILRLSAGAVFKCGYSIAMF